jgi:hypothetical protein
MVAVGMALVWAGYSVGLWGWCLIRDYNLTFGQLVSPTHPYSGTWPPAPIPSSQIWPGATTAQPGALGNLGAAISQGVAGAQAASGQGNK